MSELEILLEQKQEELLMLEDEFDLLQEEGKEEEAQDVLADIEEVKDEIERLEEALEDWEYHRGNPWKYNGVSMRDFVEW